MIMPSGCSILPTDEEAISGCLLRRMMGLQKIVESNKGSPSSLSGHKRSTDCEGPNGCDPKRPRISSSWSSSPSLDQPLADAETIKSEDLLLPDLGECEGIHGKKPRLISSTSSTFDDHPADQRLSDDLENFNFLKDQHLSADLKNINYLEDPRLLADLENVDYLEDPRLLVDMESVDYLEDQRRLLVDLESIDYWEDKLLADFHLLSQGLEDIEHWFCYVDDQSN